MAMSPSASSATKILARNPKYSSDNKLGRKQANRGRKYGGREIFPAIPMK
jgi:hypothetical protein